MATLASHPRPQIGLSTKVDAAVVIFHVNRLIFFSGYSQYLTDILSIIPSTSRAITGNPNSENGCFRVTTHDELTSVDKFDDGLPRWEWLRCANRLVALCVRHKAGRPQCRKYLPNWPTNFPFGILYVLSGRKSAQDLCLPVLADRVVNFSCPIGSVGSELGNGLIPRAGGTTSTTTTTGYPCECVATESDFC